MKPGIARTLSANARAFDCMVMWQNGMTQREISSKLGVSQARVQQLIARARWLQGTSSTHYTRTVVMSFNEMAKLMPLYGFLKEIAHG